MIQSNILGETTAEEDNALDNVFIETIQFKTLLEASDRTVVVGRRGSGKSALFLTLQKRWKNNKDIKIIDYAPESHEIIGLRSLIEPLMVSENCSKDAIKHFWVYGMLMESLKIISQHYKISKEIEHDEFLRKELKSWEPFSEYNVVTKVRKKGEDVISEIKRKNHEKQIANNYPIESLSAEKIISEIPLILKTNLLEKKLVELFNNSNYTINILMDKLDEGYESDNIGISIITGMIYACIHVNNKFKKIKPILFLRDNIYRKVVEFDTDYSRNMDSKLIRLTWDREQLLNLVIKRMIYSFDNKNTNIFINNNITDLELSVKIWNIYTENDLNDNSGFEKCLKLTFYKPRDLLTLLNQAFYIASSYGRSKINYEDVKKAAEKNSLLRIDDIKKEYKDVFPELSNILLKFSNKNTVVNNDDIDTIVKDIITDSQSNPVLVSKLKLLGSLGLIQILYSIGFIGINKNDKTLFSYDGALSDIEIQTKFLIHPCYWLALNLNKDPFTEENIAKLESANDEINDEYDANINVENVSKQIKNITTRAIKEITRQVGLIKEGKEDASKFENWCKEILNLIFANTLSNMELKPNKQAIERRDIVATNNENSKLWERIFKDYESRQIVFEIKNFKDLTHEEFRQTSSYLHSNYGKLGFIITRDHQEFPRKGTELNAIRNIYHTQDKRLIIKLTAEYLCRLLSKSNSKDEDTIDEKLSKLIDSYERNYVNLQAK